MKSGQVTIKDLARTLGIAPSTVSRALQGHPDISDATKREVNELAVKLKYQRNVVALSLKHRRSNTIGVIIPEIVHYFFSQVISGIEDVAWKEGYTVIICQSNEIYDREVDNVRTLISHRVDGILVSVSKNTFDFQHLYDIQNNEIPLVFFDRTVPGMEVDQVINNDREAACLATRHLVEQGRKRIAHFAAPQNLLIGKERKEGYLQALREAGLPFHQGLITETDSFEKAIEAVKMMKSSQQMPDAIFCSNDLTAIGAMKAIRNAGLRIPEDVAVVGFSDGQFSEISEPMLTSVDQHGFEMGTIATQMLMNRIHHPEVHSPIEKRILEANLIIRNSSVNQR